MDVSKLPKLSDTQKEQRAQAEATSAAEPPMAVVDAPASASAPATTTSRTIEYRGNPNDVSMMGGAEAWVSGIVGVICLLISKNFPAYLIAKMSGKTFHTGVNWTSGPLAGQEVAYPDLQGFTMLSDAAIFLFGVALLCEAALMLVANSNQRLARAMLTLALLLSVVATLFNGYVVAKLFGAGILPLMSLLAVAFGGYMASYQWKLLKSMSAPPMPAARA